MSKNILSDSDSALIENVKHHNDNESCKELINRHTGIYHAIVNQFSGLGAVNSSDLLDDCEFNLYKCIMDYDPTRGMKFSTFVGSRARYICLDELNRAKKYPSFTDASNSSSFLSNYVDDGSLINKSINIEDNTDKAIIEINDILNLINNEILDKRFEELVRLRHLNASGRSATWRECGEKIGLSHEGARKLYEKYKDKIKKEVIKEA